MDDGKLSEGSYRATVLIIAIVCISITVLSSIIFIPVTFALENEEREIVGYWMLISEETKSLVLEAIKSFHHKIQQDKAERDESLNKTEKY